MFLGHYGMALGLKKAAPKTPLWILIMASNFLDLLWPVLLIAGLENVEISVGITKVTPLNFSYYPFSHSLAAVVIWSILFSAIYLYWTGYKRGGLTVGFAVLSHWLLDLLMHRPDLPLSFGQTQYFGFGLWDSIAATMILEFGILIGGYYLYLAATSAKDKIGRYSLYAFIIALILLYLVSIFSKPPANAEVIGYAANLAWIPVIWAFWIERHRSEGGL